METACKYKRWIDNTSMLVTCLSMYVDVAHVGEDDRTIYIYIYYRSFKNMNLGVNLQGKQKL